MSEYLIAQVQFSEDGKSYAVNDSWAAEAGEFVIVRLDGKFTPLHKARVVVGRETAPRPCKHSIVCMAEDEALYAGGPAFVQTAEDLDRFLAGLLRMKKVPVVKSGRGNATEPHDRWHTAYISAPKSSGIRAIAFPRAGSSWSETTRSNTPTLTMACS